MATSATFMIINDVTLYDVTMSTMLVEMLNETMLDKSIPCEVQNDPPCGNPSVARISFRCAESRYAEKIFICAPCLEVLRNGEARCIKCRLVINDWIEI